MKNMFIRWLVCGVVSIVLAPALVGAGEIHDAIRAHDAEKALQLLAKDPAFHTNERDKGASAPLHWSALYGLPTGVEALLKNGADVDAQANNGSTPLHWSARRNMVEIAALLIKHGANIEATTSKGYTPLHWAAIGNGHAAADILLGANAEIDAKALKRSLP